MTQTGGCRYLLFMKLEGMLLNYFKMQEYSNIKNKVFL